MHARTHARTQGEAEGVGLSHMSGWLQARVVRGKGACLSVPSAVECTCSTAEKGEHPLQTAMSRGEPVWEENLIWRINAATGGTVQLVLRQENKIVNSAVGSVVGVSSTNVIAEGVLSLGDAVTGTTWVPLHPKKASAAPVAEVQVVWHRFFSDLAPFFEETDETAPEYVPDKYSMGRLQLEVGRISGHGYAMLTPLWWLLDLWYWNRPYESAFAFFMGSYVFYHNCFNVAFPALLTGMMLLNFVRKFSTKPVQENPAALGFLGTMSWYKETLKLSQNYLKMTNDAADATWECFNWENQDMSRILCATFGVLTLLHALFDFQWHYLFLFIWVYMFTYFPLSFYLPQLYVALLPQNIFRVLRAIATGKDVNLKRVLPLRISSIKIPVQEKKKGKVQFKVVTVLVPPPKDGEKALNTETTYTAWHRYSEYAIFYIIYCRVALCFHALRFLTTTFPHSFSMFRDRLEAIDKTMAVKGFPSKTAFNVTGEALNARRRELEAWLCAVSEQANSSRGKPFRAPLLAFLEFGEEDEE